MVGELVGAWLAQALPDADVAIASTPVEVIDLAEGGMDLLVTDLIIGGPQTGIDVGIAVKRLDSDVGVVIVTSHLMPQLLRRIPSDLASGWAYLLKTHHGPEHLSRAITAVLSGDTVLDDYLVRIAEPRPLSPLETLTPAELYVVRRVAQGWSNAAIAEDRRLTRKSVEHSLSNAYSKLGIDSRDPRLNPRVHVALAFCEFANFNQRSGAYGT